MNALDPSTLHRNWFNSSYIGPNNPLDKMGFSNYDYIPKSLGEYPAIKHDKAYDRVQASGATGVFFNTRTINADLDLFKESFMISANPYIDANSRYQTFGSSLLIIPVLPKMIFYYSLSPHNPIKYIYSPQ